MSNKGRNQKNGDEVEQLLQAAQDELLLKLSINSHLSSSDYLPSDLDRRFRALKSGPSNSPPSPPTKSSPNPNQPPTIPNQQIRKDDDLFARFAALKSSNSTTAAPPGVTGTGIDRADAVDDDEEDEVEKIIRWAKDAARLDPSPPSDDDDDGDKDETDDDDDVRK